MELLIDWNPAAGLHDSLILSVPFLGIHVIADTYYFAMDNKVLPNDSSMYKIGKTIQSLIKGWIFIINELKKNQVCYLPFDFSDQYLGCLKIVKDENDKMEMSYGYTEKIAGYGLNPSEPHLLHSFEPDYVSTSSAYKIEGDELISKLEQAIYKISLFIESDVYRNSEGGGESPHEW